MRGNSEMGLFHFIVVDLLVGLNKGFFAVVLRGVELYVYFTPCHVFGIHTTLNLKIH